MPEHRSREVPTSPLFAVERTDHDHVVRLRLRGELDLATHQILVAALSATDLAPGRAVALELADLSFCDVRGLAHVLAFSQEATAAGASVVFDGATAGVRRLAKLLCADRALSD